MMTNDGFAVPHEENVRKGVAHLLKTDLANLDAALALGVKIVVAAGEVNGVDGFPLKTAKVAMALYAKALKTVRSIRLVASAGLIEDGNTLCRSLLETCVAVHYLLLEDWQVRTDEYVAYAVLKDLSTANGWKATKGLEEAGAQLEEVVRRVIANHLGDIPPERQEHLRKTGYAGMKLPETFKKVGMELFYQVDYRALSPHAHATEYWAHFGWDPKLGLELHLGSADVPELRRLLQSSRLFFAGIMELVSRTMGLGYMFDIVRLGAELDDPTLEVVRAWRARANEKDQKLNTVTTPEAAAPEAASEIL